MAKTSARQSSEKVSTALQIVLDILRQLSKWYNPAWLRYHSVKP